MHLGLIILLLCSTLATNQVSYFNQVTSSEISKNEAFVLSDNYNEQLDIKTGYGSETGRWFISKKGGHIGFSISGGYQKNGNTVYAELLDDLPNKDVRVRLTKLDKSYHSIIVLDEKIISSKHTSNKIRYSKQLSQDQDTLYLLSVEVLGGNKEVEDTLLSVVYVPIQELKSSLSLDKQEYTNEETMILNIINDGPTEIMLGLPYKIQKLYSENWKDVPSKGAVTLQGIRLKPGKKYEQKISIMDLPEGKYRILKNVQVMGIKELQNTLDAEFEVVSHENQ
ncbi:hypothetical protein SAMN03159341_12562 [Paenibacillus sp. 1_12]|uniref:immunoglobulin-like domain-containing protein n=1 Tax=Paenibacillus sp. 1_12 TaxID=1566278 RepID=UPI0008E1ECDA|nr:immunoglobulin-like domain-containing protein [Paenibacillus sp. 1_12]SFM30757.1 hypothetical protein SAMN03159341_12562 [Paenibacillus sp. 1_12]